MAGLALALFLSYLAVVFVARAMLLRRRTGSAGWHGISGRAGSAAWSGGVLFALALLAGLLAPALQLVGVLGPVDVLDAAGAQAVGIVLFVVGFVGSVAAQRAMGKWWRVGVDGGERTELVTLGVFSLVRNPFFTALLMTALGLALLAPNALAFAALGMLFLAVELQVRCVEEPYLRSQHGRAYLAYAGRAGRLLPGAGRLRESTSHTRTAADPAGASD